MMTNEELGDLGEDLATLWATQARFIVTSVKRDRRGWDQYLEFSGPRPGSDPGPLGLGSMDFAAKLQVKATRSAQRRVSLKVSNCLRAVEDPLPWFFLIIRIDKATRSPSEVALVPLDQALVDSFLRRIWTLPPEERSRLHKHKRTLSWSEENLLEQPYAESLRERVYRAVGTDPFEYTAMKSAWRHHAGLKDGGVRGTFRVEAPTSEELYRRLARAAVGLDNEMKVRDVSFFRSRFGVEEPDPTLPSAEVASISLGPETAEPISLLAGDPDGTEVIDLPVSARFSGAVFPMLPEKHWILRLQTLFLDLTFDFSVRRFNLRLALPPVDQHVAIEEFHPSFAFLRMLARLGSVTLALQKNGQLHTLPLLDAPINPDVQLQRLIAAACALADLAHQVGASSRHAFPLRGICESGHVAWFMLLARDSRAQEKFRLNLSFSEETYEVTERFAVITDPAVRIGSVVYKDVVAFTSPPAILSRSDEGDSLVMEHATARSLKQFQCPDGQASSSWERVLQETRSLLEAQGFDRIAHLPWHHIAGNASGF